ncbi:MAG TPA: DUF998 domain-containing protein [Streptosporangiaceae bacterium]|nr:DUF998 domain-containing protein [Streptosporangiaceae bacterium]
MTRALSVTAKPALGPAQASGRPGGQPPPAVTRTTTLLARCGIVAGPLFIVAAWAQVPARPGFDPARDAISLLSIGHLGWIQVVNFLVTGALYIACAAGMRSLVSTGPGRRWIPALLYVCGAGVAGGGLFHPDPGDGFPPGTPAGASVVSSWHGVLHQVCGMSAFLALIALCFVFGRRFARTGQRRLAIGSRIAGALFAVALPASGAPGGALTLCAGVAIAMFWTAFASARILSEAGRHQRAFPAQN